MTSTPAAPSDGLPPTSTPPTVDLAERVEGLTAVDPVVRAVRPLVDKLVADPQRAQLLRGTWLGHALHPILTDVPIGFWASALTLDLLGGPTARPAAKRLIGLGVLTFPPVALTGWAEWSTTGQREQRVGVVHAVANAVAAAGFAASWRARGRGEVARGKALALASAGALGFGGFLGGHLVSARKVSSRHPAFDD
jgi:uncharacterized membrane protein